MGNVCYPALCTVAIPCWPFAVACSTEAFNFLVPSPNFYVCPGMMCHCSLSDHVHRGDPGTRNITMQPNGVDTVSFSSCCDVAHHEQVGEFVERDFKLQDQPRDRFLVDYFSNRSSGVRSDCLFDGSFDQVASCGPSIVSPDLCEKIARTTFCIYIEMSNCRSAP